MKSKLNVQSVKRMIVAAAVGVTLLVGVLGMLPTAKPTEAEVAQVQQVEGVARWVRPGLVVPQGNYWSG